MANITSSLLRNGGPILRQLLTSVALLAASVAAPVAQAEPIVHAVKYLVYSNVPLSVDIYYRVTDPPAWADYSHDPYQYSPKAEATVGPNTPWELHTGLVDPGQWAMVVAAISSPAEEPEIRCELTVDGAVVSTNKGPKGALCSIRSW